MGARMLTGLSHGATGIALSLLELFARTGREAFFTAGAGALAYEDYWFSAKHDNWPDLRSTDAGWRYGRRDVAPDATPDDQVNRDELVYGAAWCHGSPGIGLARLRALSLVPPAHRKLRQGLRASVEAAVRSTLDFLKPYRKAEGLDVSPCHGLAGLTELLLVASSHRATGSSSHPGHLGDPALRRRAEALWKPQIAAFGSSQAWPSGVASGGKNPSLLLGSAGVGYSLLRLHDESVPSVLLIAT
jgi:lantibiotic modifying enzyme